MTTTSKKKPTVLLLDAHAIIHRAYHALPDFATRGGVPTGAIFGFASMVLKIIDDFQPDYLAACYDLPGKTFRHEAFDDYKGTRSKTDDALAMQFDATRDFCERFGISIYDAPGFEADDILGTLAGELESQGVNVVIASGDMDTLQLVRGDTVRVFTLKRGMNDTVIYDEAGVIERFGFGPSSIPDYKALRGDPSDNIPGIKGIGEKAATEAIRAFGNIENLYESYDKNPGSLTQIGLTKRMAELIALGKEEAEFSKVLATIRTDAPVVAELAEMDWREHFKMNEVLSFFEQYELRALPARLHHTLNLDAPVIEKQEEEIDSLEVKHTALALWLIDSELKEASYDDLLYWAKTDSFNDAKKKVFATLAKDKKSETIYEKIELPLSLVIDGMQHNGIAVDQDFFAKLGADYHQSLAGIEAQIYLLAGNEFNVRSPKQLSTVLFDDLKISTKGIKRSSKTGIYTTNAESLEKLVDEHPVVSKILEFRELDKLLGTYIDVIPDMVGSDGRLHPTFVQNGTTTGRFSSKDPNVQNIPTRTEQGRKIREGFVAEQGNVLVSFDYSQIELRCLAMLSGDEALIRIFKEGRDVHTAVASLIGGVSEDQVDREMRRKAKVVNFGILYGMGVTSLRKEMGGERSEAQAFYDGFFEQFPKAAAFLEGTKEHARKHGYTLTLFGRRRMFTNINSKLPFIRAMAERMALNAPIQGTSADMIKLAMLDVDRFIKEEKQEKKIKLVLQIHDELIYELPQKEAESFVTKVVTLMEQVLANSYLKYTSEVPLVVHSSYGANWGELK